MTEVCGSATAWIGVVSEKVTGETEWVELQTRIGVGMTEAGWGVTAGIGIVSE